MVLGTVLLLIIGLAWFFLIRGWLWKSILFFAGWVGIHYVLDSYVPGASQTAMIFAHYAVSWSSLMATIVCAMVLLTTKAG